MLDPWKRRWDVRLLEAVGISADKLPAPETGRYVGLTRTHRIPLYSGCSHDTAAAVTGIPIQDNDELFLILGSWIMTGIELDEPVVSDIAEQYNFSNEGGCNGKIRFLKNCMGMRLFQELQRAARSLGQNFTFSQMAQAAEDSFQFQGIIDVDDPGLRHSGNLPETIRSLCQTGGQQIPNSFGEILCCITNSIAVKIACNKQQLELCTGKTIRRIRAVGGGIQNRLLCQAIANASGCPVFAGPVEASGYGNLMTQLVSSAEVSGYEQAREILKHSVSIDLYEPTRKILMRNK